MRPSERLQIIDRIARELQSRFTYADIDAYLGHYDILPPESVSINSKWVYSKEALRDSSPQVLAEIAADLEIGALPAVLAAASPPDLWKGTQDVRLFISHISRDKEKAHRLKECLKPYSISGFVAHDDIEPTKAWQSEIEKALFSMEAFVSIHTVGFSKSNWTQQEIGCAIGRGTMMMSIRMGEDPTGFASRHQALSRGRKTAEQLALEICGILERDDRTSARLSSARAERNSSSISDDEVPF
ncbi:toll/interleukin-1 receptor domain-containing protein [Pyruvatibacter mobilis]|uniref:toll/interleukin-1 receptor domain-containing protein n=1 Tax=Pyruvatibacter mobilis TaxID=1712261 RepID=UPI003C7B32E7